MAREKVSRGFSISIEVFQKLNEFSYKYKIPRSLVVEKLLKILFGIQDEEKITEIIKEKLKEQL
jgi:hypothetical protein